MRKALRRTLLLRRMNGAVWYRNGSSLSDSLVAYWKLNEVSDNRLDSVGANTLTDNNTVTSATGLVYPLAGSFASASSEYLSRTSDSVSQAGDIAFWVAAWVKLTTKVTFRPIISKFNAGATKREYMLDFEAGTDRFRWSVSNDGTALVTAAAAGAPSTGTWYFVIGWHDPTANVIGFQQNAETPVTTNHTTGIFASDSELRIGGAQGVSGAQQYMNGVIGPVMMGKGYVPDATDRAFLYNNGLGRA